MGSNDKKKQKKNQLIYTDLRVTKILELPDLRNYK